MTEDQLVEKLVSLFKGLRYSQRTWAEDARDIIAMVRENNPQRGPSKSKDLASPDAGGGPCLICGALPCDQTR